jgi:hemolysin activation/secretion protein
LGCLRAPAHVAGALLLAAVTAAAQQAPASPRFDILEFVVHGNSVLAAEAIERAVYPFLGPQRSADDVEAARRALERAYQEAGYLSVTVDIPRQRVAEAGGEVRLQVVEAPVARLRITGARYFLPSLVAAQVPSLAPGSVPNFSDMQAELSELARQSRDREITPVIAGGELPGTMAVELKVQDRLPLAGFVEANSKQAPNTVRGRLEASLSYDNLFQAGHSAGAYWYYSPRRPGEANILSLSYRLPWGGDPADQLALAFTRSASDIPTALGGTTVTRGSTFGLRWRDALRPAGPFTHALTWSATYRDTRDRNRGVAGFATDAPPLRYPVFGAGYELTRAGETAGRSSTLSAAVNFGLAALGRREVDCAGRRVDQFECKRAGAQPGFQVVNLGASHREPLPARWSFFLRGQAQFSSGPLVPAEQFTAGGVDSVRGYFDGEQTADFALALRAEVDTPRLLELAGGGLVAQLFYDRAALLRKEPLPGEIGRLQMGSFGIGLRLDTPGGLELRADWAQVLYDTRRPAAGGFEAVTGNAAGRDSRFELSVRQSF